MPLAVSRLCSVALNRIGSPIVPHSLLKLITSFIIRQTLDDISEHSHLLLNNIDQATSNEITIIGTRDKPTDQFLGKCQWHIERIRLSSGCSISVKYASLYTNCGYCLLKWICERVKWANARHIRANCANDHHSSERRMRCVYPLLTVCLMICCAPQFDTPFTCGCQNSAKHSKVRKSLESYLWTAVQGLVVSMVWLSLKCVSLIETTLRLLCRFSFRIMTVMTERD